MIDQGRVVFHNMLVAHRKSQWRNRKSAPLVRRNTRPRYPHKYERNVESLTYTILSKAVDRFMNWFSSHESVWRDEWHRYHNVLKSDSWDSQVDLFLQEFNKNVVQTSTSDTSLGFSLQHYIDQLTEFMLLYERNDFARQLEEYLGEGFYGTSTWWSTIKKIWENKLNDRIRSEIQDYSNRIRKIVSDGVRNNLTFDQIVNQIKTTSTTINANKANFLARDMIGTLSYEIQRSLHESAGIELYVWFTQGDERVRGKPGGKWPNEVPSHWIMEGIVCKWADPTVYSVNGGHAWIPRTPLMPKLHPGQDWGCRCNAAPFVALEIQGIDQQIEGGYIV